MYICNNMFVHFSSFDFPLKCLLKVWILARNYYVLLMTKEIPLNSTIAVPPKSGSSGLEVDAKLDLILIFPPSMNNINKKGIYLQVDYRSLFQRLFLG